MPAAKLLEDRIEKEESSAALLGLEQHQPVGVGHRQWPQHHRIEDAERGGRGPDAQSQRQDRDRGETWIATKHATRISKILHEPVDQRQAALIPIHFLHLLSTAECAPRRRTRIFGRKTTADVLLGEKVQMRADVIVQIAIVSTAQDECLHSHRQHAKGCHDYSSSSRFTIATVRAHVSASAASCFRPARVIE